MWLVLVAGSILAVVVVLSMLRTIGRGFMLYPKIMLAAAALILLAISMAHAQSCGTPTFLNDDRQHPTGAYKTCIENQRREEETRVQAQRQAQATYMRQVKWKKVEAANGAVFVVDVAPGHLRRASDGQVWALTCGPIQNRLCLPQNIDTLIFDCSSQSYTDTNFNLVMYAPPRSVAGAMRDIACAKSGG